MKLHVFRARRGLLRRNQWMYALYAANGNELMRSSETYNNYDDAFNEAVRIAASRIDTR